MTRPVPLPLADRAGLHGRFKSALPRAVALDWAGPVWFGLRSIQIWPESFFFYSFDFIRKLASLLLEEMEDLKDVFGQTLLDTYRLTFY